MDRYLLVACSRLGICRLIDERLREAEKFASLIGMVWPSGQNRVLLFLEQSAGVLERAVNLPVFTRHQAVCRLLLQYRGESEFGKVIAELDKLTDALTYSRFAWAATSIFLLQGRLPEALRISQMWLTVMQGCREVHRREFSGWTQRALSILIDPGYWRNRAIQRHVEAARSAVAIVAWMFEQEYHPSATSRPRGLNAAGWGPDIPGPMFAFGWPFARNIGMEWAEYAAKLSNLGGNATA